MQRIFVDSRDRVTGTNENFTITLPKSIVIPIESLAVLDTVLIPTSSYTINSNNQLVYFIETDAGGLATFHNKGMVTGFYTPETLAVELQAVLNSNPQKQVTPLYVVAYSDLKGKFEITCPVTGQETFTFLTTQWLMETDLSLFYGITDKSTLADAGRPLGFTSGPPRLGDENNPSIFAPQSCNLQPYSQMFIRGDLGVPFASFGPKGVGNILRRVVITAPSNSMNYDAASTHYDNILVAPGTYNNFTFKLTSWDGKQIDLQGVPFSFSITIFPRD